MEALKKLAKLKFQLFKTLDLYSPNKSNTVYAFCGLLAAI